MRIYQEITNDHGYVKSCSARDNNAEYRLTSARAHDDYNWYVDYYGRQPSSKWFNRHFRFERIR